MRHQHARTARCGCGIPTTAAKRSLRGHDREVWELAFSPDGSKLASAGPEGLVRVWALDLDDLVAIAKGRVTRKLTTVECRQYLRDRGC